MFSPILTRRSSIAIIVVVTIAIIQFLAVSAAPARGAMITRDDDLSESESGLSSDEEESDRESMRIVCAALLKMSQPDEIDTWKKAAAEIAAKIAKSPRVEPLDAQDALNNGMPPEVLCMLLFEDWRTFLPAGTAKESDPSGSGRAEWDSSSGTH